MYARRYEEKERTFDFASGLLKDNLLIVDRETDSVWSQLHGRAIAGPEEGRPLEIVPSIQTTWGLWRFMHPETRVLVIPSSAGRPFFYRGDLETAAGEHDVSALGLGIAIGGDALFAPLAVLARGRSPLAVQVGGKEVRVHFGDDGLSAWAESPAGELLSAVLVYQAGWLSFFPGSRLLTLGDLPGVLTSVHRSGFEGVWRGTVVHAETPMDVELVLTAHDQEVTGRFTAEHMGTFVSPVRGAYVDSTLELRLPGGGARLELQPGSNELIGEAELRDVMGTMRLARVVEPAPERWTEEDVSFGSGEVVLRGTLFLPSEGGPHPAVVLLAGRGYGSRTDMYTFAVPLARSGVAALAFDGRGRGASSGHAGTHTDADRIADGRAAIELLRARKDIRTDEVGLLGESAGGWVAPLVAQEAEVAFLVLVVGPAESVVDQQGHVIRQLMIRSGRDFGDDDFEAAEAYQRELIRLVGEGADWEEIGFMVEDARSQRWSSFVDLPDGPDDADLSWFRRHRYDTVQVLRRTTVPLLAIYGGDDWVVPPDDNAPKMRRWMEAAGNRDFEIVVVPGADHGLQVSGGFEEREYRWPGLAAGYLDALVNWVTDRVTVTQND